MFVGLSRFVFFLAARCGLVRCGFIPKRTARCGFDAINPVSHRTAPHRRLLKIPRQNRTVRRLSRKQSRDELLAAAHRIEFATARVPCGAVLTVAVTAMVTATVKITVMITVSVYDHRYEYRDRHHCLYRYHYRFRHNLPLCTFVVTVTATLWRCIHHLNRFSLPLPLPVNIPSPVPSPLLQPSPFNSLRYFAVPVAVTVRATGTLPLLFRSPFPLPLPLPLAAPLPL